MKNLFTSMLILSPRFNTGQAEPDIISGGTHLARKMRYSLQRGKFGTPKYGGTITYTSGAIMGVNWDNYSTVGAGRYLPSLLAEL